MIRRRAGAAAAIAAIMTSSTVALAEAPRGEEQRPGQEQPAEPERTISEQGERAMARLHALSQSRARFAAAGAELAPKGEKRQFLEVQAAAYQRANDKLMKVADRYQVDLDSPELARVAEQERQEWLGEHRRLRDLPAEEAADHAVSTFVRRNERAIQDLRTLRGEIPEEDVRRTIDEHIELLEQESRRAEEIQPQIQERIEEHHERR